MCSIANSKINFVFFVVAAGHSYKINFLDNYASHVVLVCLFVAALYYSCYVLKD